MNGGAHTPSSELGAAVYKKAPIPAPYKALFGELAEGASVMVYGDAGAGKTTNMIALARGLCKAGLKTLYVSFEQFGTDGLKQAQKRAGGSCPGLFFDGGKKLDKASLKNYGCMILDSISAAGWGIEELRVFLQANKGKLIFYIAQSTKDGNFRGGNDLKHEADTVVKITAGRLFTEKNRYGALAEIKNPFAK